jgi:hypothetical protein
MIDGVASILQSHYHGSLNARLELLELAAKSANYLSFCLRIVALCSSLPVSARLAECLLFATATKTTRGPRVAGSTLGSSRFLCLGVV